MYIFPKYNIQSMKLKLDVQLNIPHPPDINFTNIQSNIENIVLFKKTPEPVQFPIPCYTCTNRRIICNQDCETLVPTSLFSPNTKHLRCTEAIFRVAKPPGE